MGPINSIAEAYATREISRALVDLVRSVQTEIQDDGEFLLVRIEKESPNSDVEVEQIIKTAASVLERCIQSRSGDYAWMVNVEHRGSLLDSEVGGRK